MEWSDRKFKLAVIVLLLAILSSSFLLGFLNQDKSIDSVAYVNLERVFAEHPARTAAEKKLNQKAAEYQQQLEQEGEELSGIEQKKILNSYQKKLQNLETELLNSVLKEVERVIVQTAEAKRVKFVLEEKDILYGGYNLTDDVLAKLKADW
jgi:outer membrane protein